MNHPIIYGIIFGFVVRKTLNGMQAVTAQVEGSSAAFKLFESNITALHCGLTVAVNVIFPKHSNIFNAITNCVNAQRGPSSMAST
jgi:hypothetical protein